MRMGFAPTHRAQMPVTSGLKLVSRGFSVVIWASLTLQLYVAINERETVSLCVQKLSLHGKPGKFMTPGCSACVG